MSTSQDLITGLAITATLAALSGVIVTKVWRQGKDRANVRQRLDLWSSPRQRTEVEAEQATDTISTWFVIADNAIQKRLDIVGWQLNSRRFITTSGLIALFVAIVCVVADLALPLSLLILAALLAAPYMVLFGMADRVRTKFLHQIPDALDLLVSVLRSGLSVPQALKSVAEELPTPAGPQFAQILTCMNLGQKLPDALGSVAERFDLFELDLVGRAATIQTEVGGSLAELLDKTNSTLKERLKLKRKVAVLTAQGRLSSWLIALLPFGMAGAFQLINPLYLRPLYMTQIGKVLIVVAVLLQMLGILIVKRMATIKV